MARQQRTTAENGTGQRSRLVRMTCILGAVFILLTALALLLTPQTEAQPNITVQNLSLIHISAIPAQAAAGMAAAGGDAGD